jgi:VWFA-related protein
LVQLSVVALDAQGAPVIDLKSEDFQLWDNSKPQQVVFAHRNTLGTRTVPPGPREYSNRAGDVSPATAVLFDLLNEDMGSRGRSVKQLVDGLQHIELPDHVYLYLLTKGGTLSAVRGVPQPGEPAAAGEWTKQIAGTLETALSQTSQVRLHSLSGASEDVVKVTFTGLIALARQMAALPGPKNIVWLTQGVPLVFRNVANQNVDFTDLVRQISGDFRRANIVVNPVRTVLNVQVNERATLDLFAELTGGQAYMANEIESAIVQAEPKARGSYRIGFYPPAKGWDGKFHKIKVTCARNGVRLQAAQGYTADLAKELPIRDDKAAIAWAQSSPLEISDIGLRATSKPAASGSGSLLEVRVEASDLVLPLEQDHHRGQLVAVVNRYYNNGQPPEIEQMQGALDLTAKQFENAAAGGIDLSPDVAVNDLVAMIRIIVLDRATGAVGTLTVSPGRRN